MKALWMTTCIAAVLGVAACGSTQETPEVAEKESPPAKEEPASPPATESVTIGGNTISIDYSSPRVRGREGQLFGPDGQIGQDPNYPVWRAGANAATAFHTDADLTIGDLDVPAGDYTLFVNLGDTENWELIINKQTGQWGLKYDESQNLGRVPMTMSKPSSPVENLKYTLSAEGETSGTLTLEWENHSASVPFTVKG